MAEYFITQVERDEAEAIDRREFDRMVDRWGKEKVITWWYQKTLGINWGGPANLSPSTEGDPRR